MCMYGIPTNSRDITTTWNVFSGIHASSTPTIPICEKVLSLILSLARIRESVGTCAALRDNGVGYRILQHPSYMLCTDGRQANHLHRLRAHPSHLARPKANAAG
jgi:hypothetical protein